MAISTLTNSTMQAFHIVGYVTAGIAALALIALVVMAVMKKSKRPNPEESVALIESPTSEADSSQSVLKKIFSSTPPKAVPHNRARNRHRFLRRLLSTRSQTQLVHTTFEKDFGLTVEEFDQLSAFNPNISGSSVSSEIVTGQGAFSDTSFMLFPFSPDRLVILRSHKGSMSCAELALLFKKEGQVFCHKHLCDQQNNKLVMNNDDTTKTVVLHMKKVLENLGKSNVKGSKIDLFDRLFAIGDSQLTPVADVNDQSTSVVNANDQSPAVNSDQLQSVEAGERTTTDTNEDEVVVPVNDETSLGLDNSA